MGRIGRPVVCEDEKRPKHRLNSQRRLIRLHGSTHPQPRHSPRPRRTEPQGSNTARSLWMNVLGLRMHSVYPVRLIELISRNRYRNTLPDRRAAESGTWLSVASDSGVFVKPIPLEDWPKLNAVNSILQFPNVTKRPRPEKEPTWGLHTPVFGHGVWPRDL